MVSNLVDNALKYAGAADVTLAAEPDRVVVAVEDQGPGIPRSQREKVFEPFYRVDNSRNPDTGGVGLGLSVARSIAREHGGDVVLAARKGGGLSARLGIACIIRRGAKAGFASVLSGGKAAHRDRVGRFLGGSTNGGAETSRPPDELAKKFLRLHKDAVDFQPRRTRRDLSRHRPPISHLSLGPIGDRLTPDPAYGDVSRDLENGEIWRSGTANAAKPEQRGLPAGAGRGGYGRRFRE